MLKRKTFLWLPAAIALVGAAVSVVVLWPRRPARKRTAAGPPAARAGAYVRAVLHLGRRVGRIEEWEGEGAAGRAHWVRTLLQVKRGQRRALLRRTLSARLRPDGSLSEATLQAGQLSTSAQVTPAGIRLTVAVPERRSTHLLPHHGPLHLESTALRWLARTGLRAGRTETVDLLDLEHGWVRRVRVRVRGPRHWHGLAGTELELREATGITWGATIDAEGRVLEGDSLIPGVQTRRWRPGDADRPLYTVDLGAWGLVMTSGAIRDPRRVRRLRLKLRGLPVGFGGPPERELIAPRLVADARNPATSADLALTKAAPFLESDAPALREQARSLAPPGTPVAEAARRIARWVHDHVRQGDVVGPPSALFTLQHRRGNCNELAALTVALLRAAGHPARMAFGVAYYEGSFRYHAWPEVRVGSRMVPLDPTLAQIPADATHLRLAAGGLEAQAAILHLAGRLTVEILAVDEGSG